MAKNSSYPPGLREALRAVCALGGQFQKERMGDYRVALSAVTAGQGNYATILGRYGKGLGATNRSVKAALGGLSREARGVQRDVRRQQMSTGLAGKGYAS